MKMPKQGYKAEFKELAVKHVNEGQTPCAAARELGLVEQTLRNWVKSRYPHCMAWNMLFAQNNSRKSR